MAKTHIVHLYVWSGDAAAAQRLTAGRYPGVEILHISHRRLRESTPAGRVRLLRSLRGRAIVFYFQSLTDLKYGGLLQCVQLLHHCRETVVCDSQGRWRTMRTGGVMRALPGLLFNLLRDLTTLAYWWLYLRFWRFSPIPVSSSVSEPQVAYLIPITAALGSSGGAISHIRGFLSGLQQSGKCCRIFSGTELAQSVFPNELVEPSDQRYFFWQAASLSYNSTFARGVERRLAGQVPGLLYQRHTRFTIAGALLSRRMRVPLILEYNGPEAWVAEHWDPSPFKKLIALCEQVSLRSAARIVVVSDALKDHLLEQGFAADRIRVNPNGVDGNLFCPGGDTSIARRELRVATGEVLIGFASSFSLWHGIEVLQKTIALLLGTPQPSPLRFVLMGDGLLHGEMRSALAAYEQTGQVIFTGSLPTAKVIAYLDASDILVSPHLPMPDGSRFFGSPTKLFEYMAMGKAIIASRLEQLAEVLKHGQTGWLVTPGNVQELAEGIQWLAHDPARRKALGSAARQAALDCHSWDRNVAIALEGFSGALPSQAQRASQKKRRKEQEPVAAMLEKLSGSAGKTG